MVRERLSVSLNSWHRNRLQTVVDSGRHTSEAEVVRAAIDVYVAICNAAKKYRVIVSAEQVGGEKETICILSPR